jgi:predicted transcriptional regulator YdeE
MLRVRKVEKKRRSEMDYEIQDVPEATYAVVRRTVAFAEIPSVMPELMAKVQGWADTVPHGVHMCISSTTADGQLNLAPGVEVGGDSVDPPAGFDLVTRPAQRSAVHLYVGPYEGLPGVYEAFYAQLREDGHTEAGEPIEIYEQHDPVPQTRIIWPIG